MFDQGNFPAHIKKFGETFAKELNQIVHNLNELNVDYSNADKSVAFRERFYEDLNKAAKPMLKSGTLVTQLQIPPDEFAEKAKNLTEIQIEFIQRIIKECDESKSYEDLKKRLINVNKDIYSEVPVIEQERLFYTTAVLFFGAKEIQNLENQGQMLLTPRNSMKTIRLKSTNEISGAALSSYCLPFAIPIIIYLGAEALIYAGTIVLTAYYLYESISCVAEMTKEAFCDSKRDACIAKKWKYVNGSWVPMECSVCYGYCLANNGQWNHSSCPL